MGLTFFVGVVVIGIVIFKLVTDVILPNINKNNFGESYVDEIKGFLN